MSAELDMSQYLDLFIQEADEQLKILEQETLKLEEDPSDERMQVIFRAAHTLKGSSRAMGFSNFAQLTHEMENVLDQLRNHTLDLDTELADGLLICIDTLCEMAEKIGVGQGDSVECADIVRTLQSFHGQPPIQIDGGANKSATGDEAFCSAIGPAHFATLAEAAKQSPVYHAHFQLDDQCVMKFVRAFMAISVIQDHGELLVCEPSKELLEDEVFELDFELVFQSDAPFADLQSKLASISEVKKLDLRPWDEEHVRASQAARKAAPSSAPSADGLGSAEVPPGNSTGSNAAPSSVKAKGVKKSDSGQTVRVDVTRLDNLMNLVGELVIDRTRMAQIGSNLKELFSDKNIDDLHETLGHIGRITSDLQDQIMKIRMLPIETVFNRFPRLVRDLAKKMGKHVHLELVGGDTELDRSVIEIIGDPLLHILRNSVDHGLESPEERAKAGKPEEGRIVVSARHEENHIVIEIVDDGKGIDPEVIRNLAVEKGIVTKEQAERLSDKESLQFIFGSGFSTVKEVSEVSGRGVGMDIVRSNMHKVGGVIDLESTVGVGTTVSLRLPLTLAIIRGLLVNVKDNVYVLPLGNVIETLLVAQQEIQYVNKCEVIVIRGVSTPLIRLGESLNRDSDREEIVAAKIYVVVVGIANQRVGLIVDSLIGEQEVVISSLSRFCGHISGISGATILGDGNVALIVDVNGVVPKS